MIAPQWASRVRGSRVGRAGLSVVEVLLGLLVAGLLGHVAYEQVGLRHLRDETVQFGGALSEVATQWESTVGARTLGASKSVLPMPAAPAGWSVRADRHGVMARGGGQFHVLRAYTATAPGNEAQCVLRVVVMSRGVAGVEERVVATGAGGWWQESWVQCRVGRRVVVDYGTPRALRRYSRYAVTSVS